MFRFPPTIHLPQRLITVRLTRNKLPLLLENLVRQPRFLDKFIHHRRPPRGLIHRPKVGTSPAPGALTTTIGNPFDIAAITFSTGLGNIVNDFGDRLRGAQTGIWVER